MQVTVDNRDVVFELYTMLQTFAQFIATFPGASIPPKTRTQTPPLFGLAKIVHPPPLRPPGRRLHHPPPRCFCLAHGIYIFLLPGCNNACLLRKYCLVLTFAQYQILYCCCYSLTHRAQYSGDPENCFLLGRRADIRCEVTIHECMVGVYHILSRLLRLGSIVSSSRKRFLDVLDAILCDFMCVLVHFGS